jgi:hypothetical protein
MPDVLAGKSPKEKQDAPDGLARVVAEAFLRSSRTLPIQNE